MKLSERITRIVDFFYIKPVGKLISRQTFRFIVCGGTNMLFGLILYTLVYHFLLREQGVEWGPVKIDADILAQLIYVPVYIYSGFWLQSNITFPTSPLSQGKRFGRYVLQNIGAFVVDTAFLYVFSTLIGIYAPAAKLTADLATVIYSYLTARFFTFRGAKE